MFQTNCLCHSSSTMTNIRLHSHKDTYHYIFAIFHAHPIILHSFLSVSPANYSLAQNSVVREFYLAKTFQPFSFTLHALFWSAPLFAMAVSCCHFTKLEGSWN
jgi:hypothetical protein